MSFLDDISYEVQQYMPAMAELGIEPPDITDAWSMRRALTQLRRRLSVDLGDGPEPGPVATEHRTHLGRLPHITHSMHALRKAAFAATQDDLDTLGQTQGMLPLVVSKKGIVNLPSSSGFSADFLDALNQFFSLFRPHEAARWQSARYLYTHIADLLEYPEEYDAEHVESIERRLAMLNPRGRARRNPIEGPSVSAELDDYLHGRNEEDPQRLKMALAKTADEARALGLTPDIVASMFPREGTIQGHGDKKGSWDATSRIPAALQKHDMISRVGQPKPPSANLVAAMQKGQNPVTDEQALDYLMSSAGLSLDEARKILGEMKKSAEGSRSRTGERIAMQPSSALCKLYRSRKLPYIPPVKMLEETGNRAVIILMSPPGLTPRVMTWRRGVHLDCDMVAERPEGLLTVLSRALQSALFWVAEKPGRRKHTRIYTGRVGGTGLYLVWKPGDPVSIKQVTENLAAQRGSPFLSYQTANQAAEDVEAYNNALTNTFGTRIILPREEKTVTQKKAERTPRAERKPREKTAKSSGPTLKELKAKAKDMGIPGYSRMKKATLKGAIASAEAPQVTLPLAVSTTRATPQISEPEPELEQEQEEDSSVVADFFKAATGVALGDRKPRRARKGLTGSAFTED